MQLAITCRHGTIQEEIREYIERKADKLVTYFERVFAIEVTVDLQQDRVKVDMLVDAEHRHDFVASDVGEDVAATFDRVLQKMEQQIKKYKQKIQDHRRDRPLNEVAQRSPAGESEEEEGGD